MSRNVTLVNNLKKQAQINRYQTGPHSSNSSNHGSNRLHRLIRLGYGQNAVFKLVLCLLCALETYLKITSGGAVPQGVIAAQHNH